jgi:hypothetical protein
MAHQFLFLVDVACHLNNLVVTAVQQTGAACFPSINVRAGLRPLALNLPFSAGQIPLLHAMQAIKTLTCCSTLDLESLVMYHSSSCHLFSKDDVIQLASPNLM